MTIPAKILVFEEDTFLRLSLCMWLEAILSPRCTVIEAATAEESEALAQVHLPQIFVIDGQALGPDKSRTINQLKTTVPESKLVILTDFDYEVYNVEAVAAGASACVTKSAIVRQLPDVLIDLLAVKTRNGHNGSAHP